MANDALIPDETWVTDALGYDTPCPVCRALIDPEENGRRVHWAWHIAMVDRADRYVNPPVYGGGHGID